MWRFLREANGLVPRGISRFLKRVDGNVTAMVAIMLPVLSGATMFAVDYTELASKRTALQSAADAAALSATREEVFLYSSEEQGRPTVELLHSIAHSHAHNTLRVPENMLDTEVLLPDDDQVRVTLALTTETMFGSLTGLGGQRLIATATAEIFTSQDICLLLLEKTDSRAGIIIENSSKILAGSCGLHSNSEDTDSIKATSSAYYGVDYLCAVGGFEGGKSSFRGDVITDCPPIADPLRTRAVPLPGGNASFDPCLVEIPSEGMLLPGATIETRELDGRKTDVQVLSTGFHQMMPGFYCGGIVIEGDADVWMEPGIYVLNGGPIIVQEDASLRGDYVGLYLDDLDSYFQFLDNAEVELSAPKNGIMAGILVRTGNKCNNPPCSGERPITITSSKVRSLLGTVYLPEDRLVIDTTMPVSEEAAFTIVVAERLHLLQSPTLVLNTDYAATDVPRPEELKDVNPKIRLAR